MLTLLCSEKAFTFSSPISYKFETSKSECVSLLINYSTIPIRVHEIEAHNLTNCVNQTKRLLVTCNIPTTQRSTAQLPGTKRQIKIPIPFFQISVSASSGDMMYHTLHIQLTAEIALNIHDQFTITSVMITTKRCIVFKLLPIVLAISKT